MTGTAADALAALLDDLREAAWRGDAEAQRRYLDIGCRRAETARETINEVDKMVAAGVWRQGR